MTTPATPATSEPRAAAPTLRVGVDIGGSKIAVLVVDAADVVRARRHVPAASAEPDEAIAQIAAPTRPRSASASRAGSTAPVAT